MNMCKRILSAVLAGVMCIPTAASSVYAETSEAEQPFLQVGTVHLSLEELQAADHQVTVPVNVTSGGWYKLGYGLKFDPAEITYVKTADGDAVHKAKYEDGVNVVSGSYSGNDIGAFYIGYALAPGTDAYYIEDGIVSEITFTVNPDAQPGDVYDIAVLPEYEGNTIEIGTDTGTHTPLYAGGKIIIEGEAQHPMKGDADSDGVITLNDGVMVLNYYAKTAAGLANDLTVSQISAADVNGDGSLNLDDVVCILTYYAQTAAGLAPTWDSVISV